MATHNVIRIDNVSTHTVVLDYVTISGTVKDIGNNPLKREIVLYKYPIFETPHRTHSSESDGSWSFELKGGLNDRFLILALGIPGENTKVFDFITE